MLPLLMPVVGVDLAKTVFQLAVADDAWRVVEQQRLTRSSSSAGSPTALSAWW